MHPDEIKDIVREAVYETLHGLGISANEPHEMQADFLYMRKMRKGSDLMADRIKASIITVTIPTALYVFWDSIKQMLGK